LGSFHLIKDKKKSEGRGEVIIITVIWEVGFEEKGAALFYLKKKENLSTWKVLRSRVSSLCVRTGTPQEIYIFVFPMYKLEKTPGYVSKAEVEFSIS